MQMSFHVHANSWLATLVWTHITVILLLSIVRNARETSLLLPKMFNATLTYTHLKTIAHCT